MRKIGEIEARKLDSEDFEEYLIYSRTQERLDRELQKFHEINQGRKRQGKEVKDLNELLEDEILGTKERKLP